MTFIPHHKPSPSKELQIYRSIHPRMNLSASQKHKYDKLNKGYQGEWKFYQLLDENPSTNRIALYDFLLESNETEFQIDSLIFHHNTIFPLEIKNFEGDFYFEENNWYVVNSKREIRNPLLQLQRTEFLFKQVLHNLHVKTEVKPYLVFVNDAFTLYQSPIGPPIIYPTQLKRFINHVNTNSRPLTLQHKNLANKLISMHKEESANSRTPGYEYNQLKKGIVCKNCYGFLSPFTKVRLKCQQCNSEENIETAVMRAVDEFALLFPDRRITTGMIYEWCPVVNNKERIRKILMKHMTLIRNGRFSYYIFPKKSLKNSLTEAKT